MSDKLLTYMLYGLAALFVFGIADASLRDRRFDLNCKAAGGSTMTASVCVRPGGLINIPR